MPETTFVEVLALLLTDRGARTRFFEDRRAYVTRASVTGQDLETLLALDREGLEAQAATLLGKRLHEASPLMPVTWGKLGGAARALFLAYAEITWPPEAHRQLADAARFCRLLEDRNDPRVDASELHRLEFAAHPEKRWSCRFVRVSDARGRQKTTLELRFRDRRGKLHASALYLALS